MSYLIIQTGSTTALTAAGDYDRMFLGQLGWGAGDARIVRVFRDEPLPAPAGLRGVFITGSPAMVTDREPWSERTADWLRGAVAAGTPVLGVCYGHQLLAHALGWEAGYNPRGPEAGPVTVLPAPGATADPLLSLLPAHGERFYSIHYQSALRLPRGVAALASSEAEPHQAARFAARVWGVQFHPEFTVPVMRGILEDERDDLARAGLDVEARLAACDDRIDDAGRRLLRRFVEICG